MNFSKVQSLVGMAAQILKKKIKLYFKTLDEATRFATKNNYNFQVIEPLRRKILKKSYAQNFIKKN